MAYDIGNKQHGIVAWNVSKENSNVACAVHLLLHLQQQVHDFLCQRAVVVQIDNRLVSSCRKSIRLQLMMLCD
jgi:hypothetical protein